MLTQLTLVAWAQTTTSTAEADKVLWIKGSRPRIVRAAGTSAAPPNNCSASATCIASTSLMFLPPTVYFSTSAWNRFPSHTSQGAATAAIIARSV